MQCWTCQELTALQTLLAANPWLGGQLRRDRRDVVQDNFRERSRPPSCRLRWIRLLCARGMCPAAGPLAALCFGCRRMHHILHRTSPSGHTALIFSSLRVSRRDLAGDCTPPVVFVSFETEAAWCSRSCTVAMYRQSSTTCSFSSLDFEKLDVARNRAAD